MRADRVDKLCAATPAGVHATEEKKGHISHLYL